MHSVRALGARRIDYDVVDTDYDTVGEAMLWTPLEQGLGDEFTPEVREAWATVYSMLADAMREPVAAE